MGNYQVLNYLGGVASRTADVLANGKQVVMDCGQNVAGAIMHDGQMLINAAKGHSVGALEHGRQAVNNIGQHSINDMVAGGKNTIKNGYDYVTGTPFNQIASDAKGAITNDMAYKVAAQKAEQARNYGKTLLGDIDQFYHNTDGSYNRTKVGATIGAGLGIAGIAGYNMNN